MLEFYLKLINFYIIFNKLSFNYLSGSVFRFLYRIKGYN